jgi:hypothetical protein
MTIEVFVEPTANGYRASTGAPLQFSAEQPTEDGAVQAVRKQFADWLARGGKVVSLEVAVPAAAKTTEGMDRAARIRDISERMAKAPFLREWLMATPDIRAKKKAVEEARKLAGQNDQPGPGDEEWFLEACADLASHPNVDWFMREVIEPLPEPTDPVARDARKLAEVTARMAAYSDLDEWVQATKEGRRQMEAEEWAWERDETNTNPEQAGAPSERKAAG